VIPYEGVEFPILALAVFCPLLTSGSLRIPHADQLGERMEYIKPYKTSREYQGHISEKVPVAR